MAKKKRWYSMQASTIGGERVAEIRIYDEIGFWGMTAKDFINELDETAKDAASILVSINSPGGDVFDAFAIYNALRRHSLKVIARVDGVAASAASLVLMAGDDVVMPENAMIMIHNAWTFTAGTADELRSTADMMDKLRDGMVATYTEKSGKSDDEIIEMMDATTWMTALEAQALGFCDIIEEPVKIAANANFASIIAKFKDAPDDLLEVLDLAVASDPPAPAPDPNPDPDPSPDPDPDPDPDPKPVTASFAQITKQIFAQCREAKAPQLAEAILASATYETVEQAQTRVTDALEINGICITAKLAEKAFDFVSAGLTVEQVRARLFDAVTANSAENISNLQRPQDGDQPVSEPIFASIYAARAARSRNLRH